MSANSENQTFLSYRDSNFCFVSVVVALDVNLSLTAIIFPFRQFSQSAPPLTFGFHSQYILKMVIKSVDFLMRSQAGTLKDRLRELGVLELEGSVQELATRLHAELVQREELEAIQSDHSKDIKASATRIGLARNSAKELLEKGSVKTTDLRNIHEPDVAVLSSLRDRLVF